MPGAAPRRTWSGLGGEMNTLERLRRVTLIQVVVAMHIAELCSRTLRGLHIARRPELATRTGQHLRGPRCFLVSAAGKRPRRQPLDGLPERTGTHEPPCALPRRLVIRGSTASRLAERHLGTRYQIPPAPGLP